MYEFLLAFHSNYVPILHRFSDIATYWSKIAHLNLPHFYLVPQFWGDPVEISQRYLASSTRVPGRYLRDPAFSRFGTIPACDRRRGKQTDEQADGHTTTAYTALAELRVVKTQVQRSIGSKDRVETNGETDIRTLPITLASWITRLVNIFCRVHPVTTEKKT